MKKKRLTDKEREQKRHDFLWKKIDNHKSLYKDKRQAPEIVKSMSSAVRKSYMKQWEEDNEVSMEGTK